MFHDINWLAVVVAGLAFFILGAIWYSALFGKAWARFADIDWENPGGNMPAIFGSTLVLEILAAAVLASLVNLTGHEGWQVGLHLGLMIGIGIVFPVIAINNLYQRKPLGLIAIDARHMALGLAIAGTIVAAWR